MVESSLLVLFFWFFSGVLFLFLLFDLKCIFCVRLLIVIIEYLSIDKKKNDRVKYKIKYIYEY